MFTFFDMPLVNVHEGVGTLEYVCRGFIYLGVKFSDTRSKRNPVGAQGLVRLAQRTQLVQQRIPFFVIGTLHDNDEFVAADSVHGAVLEGLAERTAIGLDEQIPCRGKE